MTTSRCTVCKNWFLTHDEKVDLSIGKAHKKCPPSSKTKITEPSLILSASIITLAVEHQDLAPPMNGNKILADEICDQPVVCELVQGPWCCNICTFAENDNTSYLCQVCFSVKNASAGFELMRSVSIPWTCLVCACCENHTASSYCLLCYSFKGSKPVEERPVLDSDRWRCDVCTLNGNHPFSDRCRACDFPRGSKALTGNLRIEHDVE